MTIHSEIIAFFLLICYVALYIPWIWHFDHGQWWFIMGHVINPSTKSEGPKLVCSWVMPHVVSYTF